MSIGGDTYFEGPAFEARYTTDGRYEVLNESTGQWKEVTDPQMIKNIIEDATIVPSSRSLEGRVEAALPSRKPPLPLPPQSSNLSQAPRIGGVLKILRMLPK